MVVDVDFLLICNVIQNKCNLMFMLFKLPSDEDSSI